jgi:hypothetical protein
LATGVVGMGNKFASGVIDIGGHIFFLPRFSLTTSVVVTGGKFATRYQQHRRKITTGILSISCKIATGITVITIYRLCLTRFYPSS